ncbi:MAG: EAL domain-containing protein [Geobacteraceae bacterium]|nr:EAL domain-containing protein [Geobacteraceae bacterium]
MTWIKRIFRHTNTFLGQQRLVIMLVCTVVLAISQGSTLIYEYVSFNHDSRARLGAMADIIASDISAALVFGDNKAIQKTLQSLEADPSITQLFVLNDRSEVAAFYVRGSSMQTPLELEQRLQRVRREMDQSTLFELSLDVSRPIIHDGVHLGTIMLELDSSIILNKLFISFTIGTIILLFSILGSYLLAKRLGQIVTVPLLSLTATMEEVTSTKNYRLRAEVSNTVELAQLAEGFNEMLVEIANRDEILLERQESLHRQANYDTLTGLPNRTLFNDRLAQALLRSTRNEEKLAVLFIDLDDFKLINDTHGHRVGDLLLIEVSRRMKEINRAENTLARLGGDEFTAFMQNIKSEGNAIIVAHKHLSNLLLPYQIEDKNLFISASIGISLFPDHGSSAEVLLKSADAAMYLAKQKGKNHVELFTHSLYSKSSERLALQGDLRRALENNEFVLHYQPRINLQNGNLSCVEALVRWQHSDRGLIQPRTFIPLAEDTGLIMELGEWILRESCRQMQRWHSTGVLVPRVSVNVSPLQFRRQNLVELVKSALSETGLSVQCLELEITESALMDDVNQAINTLKQLQNLGVHISIDDFGTGYSSLSHLRRLPVNTIKVDRSFVMNAHVSEEDAQILSAIISMAHSLNLDTVVEGVECEEQEDLLREQTCHEVQGFYYARPMPAADLATLLLEQTLSLEPLSYHTRDERKYPLPV